MNTPGPSVDQLREAFESFDWTTAKLLLDEGGGYENTQDEVVEALRRSGKLIYEYPASGAEKKRAALFECLVSYFSGKEEKCVIPNELEIVLETFRIAEYGYRQLVTLLSKTEAAKMQPATHVAAAIRRAELDVKLVFDELDKVVKDQAAVHLNVRLPTEDGKSADPNAVHEHIVTSVAMTIQMEAFKNKWIDETGVITIPASPEVSEDDIYMVGSTALLAVAWKRWKQVEQNARLSGGRLRFLSEDEWPEETPSEIKTIIIHETNQALQVVHRIAAERLSDKLGQNLLEIIADPATKDAVRMGNKNLLPPHGFISPEELWAGEAICEAVSYSIFEDMERPGGLRLVEWVRGYCALMELVNGGKANDLIRTKSGWQHFFAGYGLVSSSSDILIDRMTFNRSSRDLFDQPMLKRNDGMFQVFAPSFSATSVAMVVLSALSNLGVQFQKKGKGFEMTVRKVFEAVGLPVYAFKAKREDEEYEYDAIVPWGDYLFVFECKNRSLPNGNPVQEHYFDLENSDNLKQVKRLMEGLDRYPDILNQNLPTEAATKTRVPILLNCLPYAIPRKVAGVYFYDYSALSRFFKKGYISSQTMVKGGGLTEVKAGPRIWSGEEPTADDFLTQLELPVQFKYVRDTLDVKRDGFQLGLDCWVFSDDLQRVIHQDITTGELKFEQSQDSHA